MASHHVETLAPNKIHSLPVIVRYHLPSSSQHFSTLFNSPQSVYVHQSTGGEGEDGWGSIYLKTVVQGVMMASPELHPCHSTTTDLSLYILDPRETYLRKSRRTTAFTSASSSAEVWTGKGLVSWALEEPGEGKNLITGRLVRSALFNSVFTANSDISPLEALVMNNGEDMWGIEVSLGLRNGNAPMFAISSSPEHASSSVPMATSSSVRSQVSHTVANVSDKGHVRRSSGVSDISFSARQVVSSPIPTPAPSHGPSYPSHLGSKLPMHRSQPHPSSSSASTLHPLSPSRVVSTTPHTKAREAPQYRNRASTTKKRYPKRPAIQRKVSRNAMRPPTTTGSSDDETFPDEIIAQLYQDPGSLTKEQAERLMASPAFLSRLSKLTGQPIAVDPEALAVRGRKRPSDGAGRPDSEKKQKVGSSEDPKDLVVKSEDDSSAPASKCWNCGRTKSAVWRTKDMSDGTTVRVCNACGLYWNKMRAMRPPKLWTGVDEDVKTAKRRDDDDKPASRLDAPTPGGPSSGLSPAGFKRTLSAVVNQDAQRIAALRKPVAPPIGSRLKHATTPASVPASSPPRASSSVPIVAYPYRNAKWTGNSLQPVAASSPGGYSQPMHPPPPPTDNFNPVPPTPRSQTNTPSNAPQDSPNTAMRKILEANTAMQSLNMPLSDDGMGLSGDNTNAFDWTNADLSAFFDVEGFSMDHSNVSMGLSTSDNLHSERTDGDDDALSQLFNRTSSAILESSPPAFDFSQLPPSSPPVIASDLPHSALLLSSPDLSPMDRRLSPLKQAYGETPSSSGKPTPMNSGLSNAAPTPMTSSGSQQGSGMPAMQDNDLKSFLAGHQFDMKALEELWRMTGEQSLAA